MPKVSKKTIQTLLETTYDEVGDKFLDCLVQQIATLTNVQTVMIHRLLTAQECKDMKENEGCPPIQVINSYLPTNEHYLFIKACYSTQQHNAL
jgi:hypothetical protein